jgi:hypothetical protein
MLLQLRDYIRRERVVSLQQLSRVFSVDESALEPMLKLWIDKGAIRPYQEQKACKRICSRCSSSAVVFYESQN